MFKLKNVLNGRCAAPDVIEISTGTQEAEITFNAGDAVCFASGALTKCSGDVSAEFIIVNKTTIAASGVGTVLVYRVTPDMVFEAPLNDYDSSTHILGNNLKFHTDGAQIGKVAASKYKVTQASTSPYGVSAVAPAFGVKIINLCGASADGDKVLCVLA